jgi:uncharacterized protein YlxP (DUF503 family)
MIVGVMKVELAIDWAQSLKDKRSVVRSLKDSLHRHHLISVAEVEDLDIHNRAVLGITLAGNSGGHIGIVLDRVLNRIRSTADAEIISCSREILHGWNGEPHELASDSPFESDSELEQTLIRLGLEAADNIETVYTENQA